MCVTKKTNLTARFSVKKQGVLPFIALREKTLIYTNKFAREKLL